MDRWWVVGLVTILVLGIGALVFSELGWTAPAEGAALDGFSPLQEVVSSLTKNVGDFVGLIGQIKTFQDENVRLRKEVDELKTYVTRLYEAGVENQRLRALLEYERNNPGRDYIVAQVIGHDPSNLVRSITVDKGTKDGISDGMVAVVGAGLVGAVVKTYPLASKVLLITDPTSTINAMVQRSRVLGIVTGTPKGVLSLIYVSQDEDVKEGDMVVTSGLGGGLPKGIPVGQVSKVSGSDMALFKEIAAEPLVDFSKVEEVLIIRDFNPTKLP